MLVQVVNVSNLHIMSKGIYDSLHEELNTLVELTIASNLLVTMASSLHIGTTSFDSHLILHEANATLQILKNVVNCVINTVHVSICKMDRKNHRRQLNNWKLC